YEGLGVPLRVLPLFDAPLNVPGAPFGVTEREIVTALRTLFVHWLTRRRPIAVYPLLGYLHVALSRRRGESAEEYDRDAHGEWAMGDGPCHAHLRRGAPEGAAHGRATGPRLPPESAPIERPPPHRVVTLLPRADLHAGAHAALLEHPPPGVRYHVRWGVHVVE